MNVQDRVYIQCAVKENIENFMKSNNISAKDMEDALNSIMINLKNQILYDLLLEQQQQSNTVEFNSDEGEINE